MSIALGAEPGATWEGLFLNCRHIIDPGKVLSFTGNNTKLQIISELGRGRYKIIYKGKNLQNKELVALTCTTRNDTHIEEMNKRLKTLSKLLSTCSYCLIPSLFQPVTIDQQRMPWLCQTSPIFDGDLANFNESVKASISQNKADGNFALKWHGHVYDAEFPLEFEEILISNIETVNTALFGPDGAIQCLQTNNITHNDLASRNILVNVLNGRIQRIKITDWDVAHWNIEQPASAYVKDVVYSLSTLMKHMPLHKSQHTFNKIARYQSIVPGYISINFILFNKACQTARTWAQKHLEAKPLSTPAQKPLSPLKLQRHFKLPRHLKLGALTLLITGALYQLGKLSFNKTPLASKLKLILSYFLPLIYSWQKSSLSVINSKGAL
ncbi:hypothetical protein COB21_05020 [Candidatus Aerophobetes bacterium]|uniref:Protein kinase domain-containing protein n=1 Tax=Aerophobetes bacterium TaxID=2030807 RepID=A0A2A4X1R1_UNCAE|nr:MAG: hypothetical protein COB21_05020 [Candidatus Aerophobetes bacterium]